MKKLKNDSHRDITKGILKISVDRFTFGLGKTIFFYYAINGFIFKFLLGGWGPFFPTFSDVTLFPIFSEWGIGLPGTYSETSPL